LFTPEQVSELQVAYDQCREGNTKIRFLTVRLYGTGKTPSEIMSSVGCSRSSLMNWSRSYQRFGIAGLVDKRAGGNSAKLRPDQVEHLAAQLKRCMPEQLLGDEAISAQF
jgi:transposase